MTDDQRDLAPPPDETRGPEDVPAGGKRKSTWRQLMVTVLAAIVLMLLVKAFVVQVYRIPSASMENTLLTGDRVLVNKLVYHGSWATTGPSPTTLAGT